MGLFLWLWRVALTWEIRWSLYAARQRRCLTSCFKFLVAVRYDGDCFIWQSDWHRQTKGKFLTGSFVASTLLQTHGSALRAEHGKNPSARGRAFFGEVVFRFEILFLNRLWKIQSEYSKNQLFSSKLCYVWIVESFPHCIFILSTCTTNSTLLVIIKLL